MAMMEISVSLPPLDGRLWLQWKCVHRWSIAKSFLN